MKSSFQTILLVVFGIVFAGAILVFSGLISFGSKSAETATPTGVVTVWGIIPRNKLQPFLDTADIGGGDYTVLYSEHDPDTIQQDLIVALANNTPPDLILFSSEVFTQFKDKLYTIPYTVISERMYRDSNIDGAQIFLTKEGMLARPLVVDPLVVYYNKDVLAKSKFVVPPRTWADLKSAIPLLTVRDVRNNITQSAIALGTASNINHSRDILSALFLQTGNSIISYDSGSNTPISMLGATPAGSLQAPTATALEFYTSFSNTTNSNYSWNISLPESLQYFLAGKSAFYIGRASELFTIQAQNPNLNFDVMQLFQTGADTRAITFGSFLGIGMLKDAPNPVAAYAALTAMSTPASIDAISKTLSLPPVERSLLLARQDNPYVSVFFTSALSSFAWPDQNPVQTKTIFREMVTDLTSGRTDAATAISNASTKLQ
jgi:ABC-type glycerol-3-phosphate transport system substrate-binding protein